jgi:hypothetical protein
MVTQMLRTVIAVVYRGGGLFHLWAIGSGRLDLYRAFDDRAIGVYQSFWSGFVEPALPWIVAPVIIGEWTLGMLMLGRGRAARLGQLGGAAWNLVLAPFDPPWTGCVALTAVHLWLATHTFDRAAWEVLGRTSERAAG